MADITTSLKGGRDVYDLANTTLANIAMRISVLTFLSCASSITITEYYLSRASLTSSLSKIPSVMN